MSSYNDTRRWFRSWRKWVLYLGILITAGTSLLTIGFVLAPCTVSNLIWARNNHPSARCGDYSLFSVTITIDCSTFSIAKLRDTHINCPIILVWDIFFDALLALIPITIIWKLQMIVRKKVTCCIILGLSAM